MNEVTLSLMRNYLHYDEKRAREQYRALKDRLWHGVNQIPFRAVVRMRDKRLAMQLKVKGPVLPDNLRVAVYFLFEHFSTMKDCLWTVDEGKIINFFTEGVQCLLKLGGEVVLELGKKDIRTVVKLMTNPERQRDREIFDKLCEHFDAFLGQESWHDYYKHVEDLVDERLDEEHVEEVTCMDLPMDWENTFATSEQSAGVHAETISDGLIYSLSNLGRVDIEYISQITGEDLKTVIYALKGAIYQNPETWEECFYKGWESADEYLSGRVLQKWKTAVQENKKYRGYFEENVKALEDILPKVVSSDEIYVTLGSPWVPTDIIDEFIVHLLGYFSSMGKKGSEFCVTHDEESGIWHIPHKSRYKGQIASISTYGTKRMEALHIMERTLNQRSVTVLDEVQVPGTDIVRRVVNKEETLLAIEKQKAMINKFQKWVWADEKRRARLEDIFDERFGSRIVRRFNGSYLTFPGMSDEIALYDYQKNAVARILYSPNVLLAQEVGAGKTYVMTAAGMELRRMGISRKNVYAVPNNLVGQWRDIFLSMYPGAKLLCIEPKTFPLKKRTEVLEDMKNGDYDGIIIAHSSLELIPVSNSHYRAKLRRELDAIGKRLEEQNKKDKRLIARKKQIYKELKKLESRVLAVPEELCFDALGVNTLFVDEAHNYKNLALDMNLDRVMGVSKTGSAKCADMLEKVRIVQQNNNGRGVVMATGTPITNSVTDIFVMQKYLQNGELTLLDLHNFNAWVSMFAEPCTDFEIDVDTNSYRLATRISRFHNLPELAALLSSIADFHQVDKENGIPEHDGYQESLIGRTKAFKAYLDEISVRADNVRTRGVPPEEDNMLKITTDGRKAALDLRLAVEDAVFTPESKVAKCAEKVFRIWKKTEKARSTQLVFCDIGTPKAGFNLYDEMKRLLLEKGVPEEEIAFVHSATTERARNALFAKVRKGEIRVLLGSTMRLGQGVNVQDKLVAVHHLDVPWRPSDMIQREGRILRRGNENETVEIHRYVTKGSFDAYSWQLLEAKQRVIVSILSGCLEARSAADVDDTVLDYAEVKALAIGNDLIKTRVETANELSRHITLQRRAVEMRQVMEKELAELPAKIAYQESLIRKCDADILFYRQNKKEYEKEERKELRLLIHQAVQENELMPVENLLCHYQGFSVILPTNMRKDKPFVYLQKNGRYFIELGLKDVGVLTRIDHFLDGLGKHRDKLYEHLEGFRRKRDEIKAELSKKHDHAESIEKLTQMLADIDNKLGVKKDA